MESIDYIPGTEISLIQDRDSFSFGVDAVLLSDFARQKKGGTLVDIGTGGGIIALRCLALYSLSSVIGIEIQKSVADMARRSVELNNLGSKVQILNEDIRYLNYDQIFSGNKVDNVVVNPPYIEVGRGIENKSENDLLSRTEMTLKLEDVFRFSAGILREKGSLYMVHRANRLVDILSSSRAHNLEPRRMRTVHSFSNSPPNLVLIEFIYCGGVNFKIEKPLVIYSSQNTYTDELMEIYYGKK